MNATPGPRAPGPRADTARPALVPLPGVPSDATVWADQVADLAGRADVTVGDLDGADGIVGTTDAVLALSPDRFAVAGHSMGGHVALEIVRRAPRRVLALALLDCGAHPPEPREREVRLALLALARAEGMAALAERPTLVPCGRRDDWCPLSRHQAMAAAIPGAVLAVVEDRGHMAMMEQPQAVTAALSAWLDRLPGPSAPRH